MEVVQERRRGQPLENLDGWVEEGDGPVGGARGLEIAGFEDSGDVGRPAYGSDVGGSEGEVVEVGQNRDA